MSEFPVSNLEKRLFWGIGCAVAAMVLNLGTPLVLMMLGITPQWPTQQGPLGGMGIGILLAVGIVLSGSAGFVAGLMRPGSQAVIMTLICLVLVDVCMMATSMLLYFISAAIKVTLMIAVKRESPKGTG